MSTLAAARRWRVRRGQFVAAEAAAAALLAAWSAGAVPLALVAPVALAGLMIAVVRVRGRWAYEWLALALGYAGRRRTLPPGAEPGQLLGLARPDVEPVTMELDGAPVGVLTDAGGPTAIVSIGDAGAVLAEPGPPLPALRALLPPAEPAEPAQPAQPTIRLRLVAATIAAPAPGAGSGPAATAYRQLTAGDVPGYRRIVLAVQARRGGPHTEPELHRALGSAVRRICRRLGRAGLVAAPLGPVAATRILAEFAHHDAVAATAESWPALVVGGRHQATFRLDGLDRPAGATVSGLLTLPGCAVTVAVAVQGPAAEAHVRLTTAGPAELTAAVQVLRQRLAAAGVTARRLDGAHLTGLAATLPVGAAAELRTTGSSASGAPEPGDLVAGGAGLMLGTNRRDEPVVVRLFRPDPTRVVLVGEPVQAQLLALRAMALGARVFIQTGRPAAWEPFVRAVSGPRMTVNMSAPGRSIDPPPAGPLAPQLLVLDAVGTPAAPAPAAEQPWRTTLALRDQVSPADVDLLARADLVLLAPISEPEAVLAGAALGLGDTADWLARIRGDMLGAVVPRRTVRWAMASPTPLERQLLS